MYQRACALITTRLFKFPSHSILKQTGNNTVSSFLACPFSAITLPISSLIFHKIQFSTSTTSFAVVDHAQAYNEAISGSHGRQLALAYKEYERVVENSRFIPYDTDDDEKEDSKNVDENENNALMSNGDESSLNNDKTKNQKNEMNEGVNEEEEEEEDGDEFVINDKYQYLTKPQRAALKAGSPAGGVFAVVCLAKSSQFKVTVDDVIICNKLKPVDKWKVGSIISLSPSEILMVASPEKTYVGLPCVNGAQVIVRVEEITHDKTAIIFKKRRRKNSKRKKGFRREVTFLRVLDIRMPSSQADISNDFTKSSSLAA